MTASTLDYAKIAAGVEEVKDEDIKGTRVQRPNPFTDVVKKAMKSGHRYVIKGRFSMTPYPGKKNACEAYSVVAKLHNAAQREGTKVSVRRFDFADDNTCRVTFKVLKAGEEAS